MTANQLDSFQAIADPNRREILMLIAREKLSINSIAENFEISRPAISKHVKVLYQSGFISIETKGRERICVLNQAGFDEIQQWINFFEQYWNSKLKTLENILNNNKNKNNEND